MRITLIYMLLVMAQSQTLYNFTQESKPTDWYIVDDVVMGGRSSGDFTINSEGLGEFSGVISLENNGGFSSVRHQFNTTVIKSYSKFVIRLKGDGKTYQFRVKTSSKEYASYVYEFRTSTDWMTIEIPFSEMQPRFRGRRLDLPNFQGQYVSEIAFLIGNKKPQQFKLLIDKIEVKKD